MKEGIRLLFFFCFFTSTTVFAQEPAQQDLESLLAQAAETVVQLTQLQNELTEQYQQKPTPVLQADIIIINEILEELEAYLQELRSNDEPNNNHDQQPTPDQIVHASQQQIIDNLINAIDQSNSTIEKLTSPERWKYIKYGLYALGGIAAVATTITLVYLGYKKLYSIFSSPIEAINQEIEEKLEETEHLGEKITEDVTDIQTKLQPVSENTKSIKKNLKKGIKILDNVTKNTIPELKRKINNDIAVFKLLSDLRDLRKKEKEKVDALEQEIAQLKTQKHLQDHEIFELNRRIRKEEKHMRTYSTKLGDVADELINQKRRLIEARDKMKLNTSPLQKTEDRLKKVTRFKKNKKR